MKITRKWTKAGQNPFETVAWTTRSSKISNPDGSVVFQMDDAEVPETWSFRSDERTVDLAFHDDFIASSGIQAKESKSSASIFSARPSAVAMSATP